MEPEQAAAPKQDGVEGKKKPWAGPPGSQYRGGQKGPKPNASLRAARIVSKEPERASEKGLVKVYRDMMKKDPVSFARELRGLEREHAALRKKVMPDNGSASGAVGGTAVEEEEETEGRSMEICRSWLQARGG